MFGVGFFILNREELMPSSAHSQGVYAAFFSLPAKQLRPAVLLWPGVRKARTWYSWSEDQWKPEEATIVAK